MNPSVISWISQQSPLELYSNIHRRQITAGIESSILVNQCELMGSFEQGLTSVFGQDILSPANVSTSDQIYMEQPEHQTPHYYTDFSSLHNMGVLDSRYHNPLQQRNPRRLSPIEEIALPDNLDPEEAAPQRKKKRIRPPSQTYDHIIAERRRREQLSQLFAALSALIPGLKKMDKSSILEDAIKYMKHLQERVGVLEENAERKAMESAVMVRKSRIVIDGNDEETWNEERNSWEEQPLPEIEGRVCDNHILVKVHCEKKKDALANLIGKVENLNLTVVSTNATPFGGATLDITIVAEMEKEFNLTVKDVVIALREVLNPASSTEILTTC